MLKDKKTPKNKKNLILTVGLIVIVGGGGFIFGWLSANDWYFSTNVKEITPDLDGTINKREWLRCSYYNIPFYLDVDNTVDPLVNLTNIDGWNYLSVAEDEENYYIALDLCSDRTNNLEGEWVALALANRMPQVNNAKLGLYAIENYGLEYLMYNVTTDDIFEEEITIFSSEGNFYDIPFVPEYESYNLIRGTMEGDYLDFWYTDDNNALTLKSEYFDVDPHYNESDIVAVDFAVNITEKFPSLNASDFIADIDDFELDIRITGNMSANNALSSNFAEYFSLRVAEHGPMPVAYDDPHYLDELSTITFTNGTYISPGHLDLDFNTINSSNGMFYFSIFGWNYLNVTNPTAFEIYIDQLELYLSTNSLNIGTTKGTSLNSGNYDVSYAYGSSDMCAENHRMFEIRVAKSEFPDLIDDMLYVNIAGYGTMAIADSNYWIYPQSDDGIMASPIFGFYDDSTDFLKFDMSIT